MKKVSDFKEFLHEYDKLSKELNIITKNIPQTFTVSEEFDGILYDLFSLTERTNTLSNLSKLSLEPAKMFDFQVVVAALQLLVLQKIVEVQNKKYTFDVSRLKEAIEKLEAKTNQ